MGIFDKDRDKDEKPKADFSGVRGQEKKADFSNVSGSMETTAPEATEAGGAVERERTYTVVSGDSLSKIAKKQYGDANKWKAIYEANKDKIKNPDLIYPGQVLNLPADA
jgi:nucleoid-associated protein YgaU